MPFDIECNDKVPSGRKARIAARQVARRQRRARIRRRRKAGSR